MINCEDLRQLWDTLKMRLAVLGASGPTGLQVLEQAVNGGEHDVVAIVRSPEKITIKNDKLKVVKADIFKTTDLVEHFTSCDAVISCLGSRSLWNVTLYSETIKAIIPAMRETNVKRLVCVTSAYTTDDPDHTRFVRWFLKPVILGHVLKDMRRMEEYLEQDCQDINYTAVRPPGLSMAEIDGRELLVEPDVDHSDKMNRSLPRANLAKFLLNIVGKDTYDKKCVSVGLPK